MHSQIRCKDRKRSQRATGFGKEMALDDRRSARTYTQEPRDGSPLKVSSPLSVLYRENRRPRGTCDTPGRRVFDTWFNINGQYFIWESYFAKEQRYKSGHTRAKQCFAHFGYWPGTGLNCPNCPVCPLGGHGRGIMAVSIGLFLSQAKF